MEDGWDKRIVEGNLVVREKLKVTEENMVEMMV